MRGGVCIQRLPFSWRGSTFLQCYAVVISPWDQTQYAQRKEAFSLLSAITANANKKSLLSLQGAIVIKPTSADFTTEIVHLIPGR
jgi:hypothetical protein